MTLKVGVLCGGKSIEREISLKSGEAVFKALKTKGYNAVKIDPADYDFIERIKLENIDVAFIALHGKYGEDGTVQGFFEILGIPYTGSKVLASAVAMNKVMTKKMFVSSDIPTPKFCTYTLEEINNSGLEEICKNIAKEFSFPLIAKAPNQGSTIGVVLVENIDALPNALEEALKYDKIVMIEQFIEGTEVTVPIIGGCDLKVLPQIEIVPAGKLYDYNAKYVKGMSKHIIPPRLPDECLKRVSELALCAYRAIGCDGVARIDFIVTTQGKAYALEINTSPGMTEMSLVPESARAAGIEFPDLVDMIVKLALENSK